MTKQGDRNSIGAMILTAVFVLAALVPNIVLAVTEPYRITTILASLLIPGGLYLAWCMISRRPALMILWGIPLMILCAFQLVISYLFGNSIIAVDMFLNLVTTNSSEAGELLSGIYPSIIIVCAIYVPVIIFAVRSMRRKDTLSGRGRKRGAVTGAVSVIAGILLCLVSYTNNRNFALNKHIFPFNVCHNMNLSVGRWWQAHRYPANVRDFSFGRVTRSKPDSQNRQIHVLVIGEASRAASWGLYGYGRQTTPRLSETDGLVVFRDVLTESNTTHKSVPILLSAAAAENYDEIYDVKGICALMSQGGYRTVFITNQPPNRSLTDFLASEADTLIKVSGHGKGLNQCYDGDILPHLNSVIASSRDDMFIVVHTYGSHARHEKRYPGEFACFTPDEAPQISPQYRDILVNAYDNSILYTDYLLSEIITILDSGDHSSTLLYCSDHGEDLMDDSRNRFLHASPTATYYQLHVPAFIRFSEAYEAQNPSLVAHARDNTAKAASTGDIFHTLSQIAGVASDHTDAHRSWVSEGYRSRERLYVNDHDDAVNVMRMGLTDEDVKQMRTHGVTFDLSEYIREKF